MTSPFSPIDIKESPAATDGAVSQVFHIATIIAIGNNPRATAVGRSRQENVTAGCGSSRWVWEVFLDAVGFMTSFRWIRFPER
jgi:hypothetical protein